MGRLRVDFADVVKDYVVGGDKADPKTSTVFHYREINAGHDEDATVEAGESGKFLRPVYVRSLWSKILVGWERFDGPKGEIPFAVPAGMKNAKGEQMTQAEWVHYVVRSLPLALRQDIEGRATAGYKLQEKALGN